MNNKVLKAIKEIKVTNPMVLFKEYYSDNGFWFEEMIIFPVDQDEYEFELTYYFKSKVQDVVKGTCCEKEIVNFVTNRGYRFELKENLMF